MTARGDRISSGGSLASYTWRLQAEAAEQRDNDELPSFAGDRLAAPARSISQSGSVCVQDHYLSAVVSTSL